MATYKKALPQVAASSSFDVGPSLTAVLAQLSGSETEQADLTALRKQSSALVAIARLSRGTKWWHKPNSDGRSLVLDLLVDRVHSGINGALDTSMDDPLRHILVEGGIMQDGEADWSALLRSLRDLPQDRILESYLENCMIRITRRPVQYIEQLEEAQRQCGDESSVSLLVPALTEQLPFLLKTGDVGSVPAFIANFLALLESAVSGQAVLQHFREQMLASASSHNQSKVFKKAFKAASKERLQVPTPDVRSSPDESKKNSSSLRAPEPFAPLPALPTVHTLPSSYSVDADLSISPSNSRLAAMIRTLASPTTEYRLGSLSALTNLLATLPSSTYSEAEQVHLLLGELLETARMHAMATANLPLPAIVSEVAVMTLTVITDPSDEMYSTVMKWLMRHPNWMPLTRVIPYWTSRLLHEELESDTPGAGDAAITRLLGAIADGMRDNQDADLCRRAGLWERIGSLYMRTGCRREVRRSILRCLWTVCAISGGADTLITRAGMRRWMSMVEARERGEMKDVVVQLRARLDAAADDAYLRNWEESRGHKREST
jgi:nucleolar pre-ribosomal-associated protein 1